MNGRESLLADIEARQRKTAEDYVEVLQADLKYASENTGYDPYDNPGPAKPLDTDGNTTARRKALKARIKSR